MILELATKMNGAPTMSQSENRPSKARFHGILAPNLLVVPLYLAGAIRRQ